MNTFQVTVQIQSADKETARRIMEAQGYTVTRVAAPKAKAASVTPAQAGIRAGALLDQPAGLDYLEGCAYRRGYAAECLRYAKKHGTPRPGDGVSLRDATIRYEWDRHPAARKAGMRELAKEQTIRPRHTTTRLESVA